MAAMGIKADLTKAYADFAKIESKKFKMPQEDSLLIVTTKRDDF